MGIKDVLLALTSYPDPAPGASIDRAVAFAQQIDAQITGLAFQTEIKLTRSNGLLTRLLVDVPAMAAEETAKSKAHAAHLKSYFQASATRQRARYESRVETCEAFGMAEALVEHAKLHDLTVLPLQDTYGVEQWHAESAVFGSGRPVLLLPGPKKAKTEPILSNIVFAWDFSRPAVRALADALPLLQHAQHVQIVIVENEKDLVVSLAPQELSRHLAVHGIESKFEAIDAKGRSAAAALRDYTASIGGSLLVMGAYGHSRVREFVLGGVTCSMLDDPPIPVFLSH